MLLSTTLSIPTDENILTSKIPTQKLRDLLGVLALDRPKSEPRKLHLISQKVSKTQNGPSADMDPS